MEHTLSDHQNEIALRFVQSRDVKFVGSNDTIGLGHAPLLKGALAMLQCWNASRHEGGDHFLFSGQVEKTEPNISKPFIFRPGELVNISRLKMRTCDG